MASSEPTEKSKTTIFIESFVAGIPAAILAAISSLVLAWRLAPAGTVSVGAPVHFGEASSFVILVENQESKTIDGLWMQVPANISAEHIASSAALNIQFEAVNPSAPLRRVNVSTPATPSFPA